MLESKIDKERVIAREEGVRERNRGIYRYIK
jgi:hypothetical protein